MPEFYTEEGGSGVTIIRLSKKEGKLLMDMLELAAETNKRKPSFKKMRKDFAANLTCF